jgi:hypothetical protein
VDRRETVAKLGPRPRFDPLDQVSEDFIEDIDLLITEPTRRRALMRRSFEPLRSASSSSMISDCPTLMTTAPPATRGGDGGPTVRAVTYADMIE